MIQSLQIAGEINGAFNRNSRRIFPVGFLLFLSRLKTEKNVKRQMRLLFEYVANESIESMIMRILHLK